MTIKKTSTKKTARRRATIKDRARAIIADAEGYNKDTRLAVEYSLEYDSAATLRETVEQAEAGETILDLGAVAVRYEKLAGLVVQLLNNDADLPLPDFLLEGCMDAIRAAACHFNAEYMEADADRGLSVSKLADLFSYANAKDYQLPEPPALTLADHISAVLKHPDTPTVLYDAMSDVITTMLSDVDHDTPEMIAKGLAAFEAKQGEQEGGAE